MKAKHDVGSNRLIQRITNHNLSQPNDMPMLRLRQRLNLPQRRDRKAVVRNLHLQLLQRDNLPGGRFSRARNPPVRAFLDVIELLEVVDVPARAPCRRIEA